MSANESRLVSDAEANQVRALTAAEVSREAARMLRELDERFRIHGFAAVETATEDNDWVTLDRALREEGAASVGALPHPQAEYWVRRMAAHARRRRVTGR
jgi:hypothetical protein